jgi:hypothetical protein
MKRTQIKPITTTITPPTSTAMLSTMVATLSSTGLTTLFCPSDAFISEYRLIAFIPSPQFSCVFERRIRLYYLLRIIWFLRIEALTLCSLHFLIVSIEHFSNDVDVILFSVFPNHYNQCADTPVGTYIAPVSSYINGYLNQKAQDMEDQGYEYEWPDAGQYTSCTAFQSQNQVYYMQLGCADGNSLALAVNMYTDNTCTTRSVVDGMDDSVIDVTDITVRRGCRGFVKHSTPTTSLLTMLLLLYSLCNCHESPNLKSAALVSTGLIEATTTWTINFTKTECKTHHCVKQLGSTSKNAVANANRLVSRRLKVLGVLRTKFCWRS